MVVTILLIVKYTSNHKFNKYLISIFVSLSILFTSPKSSLANNSVPTTTLDPWGVGEIQDLKYQVDTKPEVEVETKIQTYTVQNGDNLWLISEKNSPSNFTEYWIQIIEKNKNTLISENPNLIYPGEQIILPKNL
ncbi:MAG: LysM peptidoglycan-binding domain-containing protein [Acidimicrobiia bacterium]